MPGYVTVLRSEVNDAMSMESSPVLQVIIDRNFRGPFLYNHRNPNLIQALLPLQLRFRQQSFILTPLKCSGCFAKSNKRFALHAAATGVNKLKFLVVRNLCSRIFQVHNP